MNRIKLRRIKFKAFRSFKDEQEIGPLPDSGLYCIKGVNNNTGGSSGSGKSNFHSVINFAIGNCPYYEKDLQSWFTEDKMQVELTYDTPAGSAIIKRGKENSFSLNGIEVSGSIKKVQSAIQESIGLPIELLDALTFRQQKTPGRFLSMTDSEKKDFLSTVLGLQELELSIENAVKESNLIKTNLDSEEAIYTSLLTQISEPSPPLKVEDSEVMLSKIDENNIQINSKKENLFELQRLVNVIESQYQDISLERVGNIDFEETKRLQDLQYKLDLKLKTPNTELDKLNKELSYLELKINGFDVRKQEIAAKQEALSIITSELEKCNDTHCPTCNQLWDGGRRKQEELTLKINEIYCFIQERKQYLVDENQILDKYKLIKEKISSIIYMPDPEIVYLKDEIDKINVELRHKIEKAKNDFTLKKYKKLNDLKNDKSDLIAQINELQIAINDLTGKNKGLEQAILYSKQIFDNYQKELEKYNRLKDKLSDLETKINIQKEKYRKESDFADLCKGFLGAIFEEILNEISIESNNMLKSLPNVSNLTIQFNTEKVNAKGTVKQEIKVAAYKNGIELPSLKALSGGQGTSVELIVDLAIGNIIGRRTGVIPGWLILDESFDGHDVPVKEACLELLKTVASDRLIFVIDHSSEVSELFDKVILVESENDISTVKEINAR